MTGYAGRSPAFQHVERWTANAISKSFLNLGAYTEIVLIGSGITLSGSGTRLVEVSTDNGGSWLADSGIYGSPDSNGVETDLYWGRGHYTDTALARSFYMHILPWSVAGGDKMVIANLPQIIHVTDPLNAIRVRGWDTVGSVDRTMTGGTLDVWGKP